MKHILPLSFKYVFKSLGGGSLRYKVFLVSNMIALLAKTGKA